jgi:hypothetical protein
MINLLCNIVANHFAGVRIVLLRERVVRHEHVLHAR